MPVHHPCIIAFRADIEQTLTEVVAAWADPEVFSNGRWQFPGEQRRSIHYQAGGSFFATGDEFQV